MDLFPATLAGLDPRELRTFAARGLRQRFEVWPVTPVDSRRRGERRKRRRDRPRRARQAASFRHGADGVDETPGQDQRPARRRQDIQGRVRLLLRHASKITVFCPGLPATLPTGFVGRDRDRLKNIFFCPRIRPPASTSASPPSWASGGSMLPGIMKIPAIPCTFILSVSKRR